MVMSGLGLLSARTVLMMLFELGSVETTWL
jgi:hypothetical protein